MLNTSVWLRTEHVEHQRVTQNWTCLTSACDSELNMLNTSVWLRTEDAEHRRVTQNWTCWTPACAAEFHSLVFMWANTKQFHRLKTAVWLFLRRFEHCGKITTVPWTNHWTTPLVMCTADYEHLTPCWFYPFSGSKFRDSVVLFVTEAPLHFLCLVIIYDNRYRSPSARTMRSDINCESTSAVSLPSKLKSAVHYLTNCVEFVFTKKETRILWRSKTTNINLHYRTYKD
jgi:hypothetical protein